jgi:hypothetical protein
MIRTRLHLAGLFAVALAFSPEARADEPTQAEVEYRPDRYPATGTGSSLIVAGSGIALGGYAIGFGTSYLWADAPTAADLRLPVVGPVLALAGAGCGNGEAGCGTLSVVVRSVFAVISGIGQLGGLALITEGLFLPTADAPSSAQSAREIQHPSTATPRFVFSPVATDTTLGFNLGGQF